MNLRKWFGGKEDDEDVDGLVDLSLEAMKTGYLVDHDLETWEVIGYNSYDYDGFITREWELRSGDEVRFLELAVDDARPEWTLTRAITLGDVEEDVLASIGAQDEPPETVHFDGRPYTGAESEAGVQRREAGGAATAEDGGSGREFVAWTYRSEEGRLLYLVRWGERDLSAYEGQRVEEYQFTDILPGGRV
ncbi:DUF4178 domain-containing protein [Candidatus Latescibacterota bacterium]